MEWILHICAKVWALHHYTDTTGQRVLVCGQCHDKLSILSMTVAEVSQWDMTEGVGRRPRPSPSSHTDESVGQQVTESANCNLLPLLIQRMKGRRCIKWYTVLENQCLSWHRFMNGQGQFLGFGLVVDGDFNEWDNYCDTRWILEQLSKYLPIYCYVWKSITPMLSNILNPIDLVMMPLVSLH